VQAAARDIGVASVKLASQQFGSGPDLILVHGLGANRAFWYPRLASALAQDFSVTIYDLRGHGYSDVPSSGYSTTAMARDLLALMDERGIAHAALVGHSYGGAIALEAVAAQPARFTHLCLMDTRVQRLQPELRLRDIDALTSFERAVAAHDGGDWQDDPEIGFRFLEAAARCVVDGVDLGVRDAFTPFGEGRGAKRAARAWLRLLDETSARTEFVTPGADVAILRALRLPTLLMYAGHSRALRSGEQLAALLPHARWQRVAGGGHFFPVSHVAETLAELRDFLR
jgi:pimeloyl-ACP methyl ester carboxylesterase